MMNSTYGTELQPSLRDSDGNTSLFPAINRWAILERPYGTEWG